MLTRIDLKNTISLVGAEGISRVLAFVLTVYIARSLGVYDFGAYSTAVSFVFLFSVFIEIGLSTYVYREISKDKDAATRYITSALILQIFLSVVVGGVVSIAAVISKYPPETRTLISLLWFWMIGINLGRMIRVVFKAYLVMEFDALVNILENGVRFILVLLTLRLGFGVLGIAVASIVSAFLMLAVSMWLSASGKYLNFAQTRWNPTFTVGLLRAALPFSLSMIATVIMYRISVVALSILQDTYAVGVFDASFKLTMSLFFIPALICNAFFSKMSQYAVSQRLEYSKIVILLTQYIFLLMYPLLILIYIFSPEIIGVLYTEDFFSTIPILQILVWVNFFNSGTYIGVYALNAAGYEKKVMKVMLIGISVKVAISVAMIIWNSYTGAAVSALFSEIIVTILLFYYLLRENMVEQLQIMLLKIAFVTIVSFGFIFFAQWLNFNDVMMVFCFMTSFIVSVIFSKLVTVKDVNSLRRLFTSNIISG